MVHDILNAYYVTLEYDGQVPKQQMVIAQSIQDAIGYAQFNEKWATFQRVPTAAKLIAENVVIAPTSTPAVTLKENSSGKKR